MGGTYKLPYEKNMLISRDINFPWNVSRENPICNTARVIYNVIRSFISRDIEPEVWIRGFNWILEIGTEEMTAFVSILRTNFTSLMPDKKVRVELTHWGRVTHICVGKLTIIGSDNGLSPGRRQAIICTNGGILLIRPLGTNFSEILIGIQTFSFKKMHLRKRGWGSEWVCGWIGDRMCDCIIFCVLSESGVSF